MSPSEITNLEREGLQVTNQDLQTDKRSVTCRT